MRKIIASGLAILLLTLLAVSVTADELSTANTANTASAIGGTSAEELEQFIQTEFAKTHIPGMSVSIVDADSTLFTGTYGNVSDTRTSFILGSITKSFTAVAIMQLAEQGLVDVNSPFVTYLPEEEKNANSKTTVKQLLNHTSGIRTYKTPKNYSTSAETSPYEYSNSGYGLLGKIVERVSGMDYGSYIKKHIFEPLGMTRSYVSLKDAKAAGFMADGYRNYFGIMVKQDMPYPYGEINQWLNLPAGYIISCTEDMGKYLQAYLNQGEGILTPESVNTMMSGQVDFLGTYQYGMGWMTDLRANEKMYVHGGNVENFTTYMHILPERGIAIVVLTNTCDLFIANNMMVQLADNLAYKVMGADTVEIGAADYWQSHLLINAALFIVLLIGLLPLLTLKRWRRKNREHICTSGIVSLVALHAVLPTLILPIIPILGIPLSVIRGFVPDIFVVLLVSSGLLYLTGVLKVGSVAASRLNRRRSIIE
ncbi:MAG: beta-lactamase family protein [Oscillospiraceae bacterium]|jgi:CubicO group peptidase (beta-lactamase class C family)|nr:beta-lactamase family protein [Oscillospiraceae bacterium]